MTWFTITVAREAMAKALARIRGEGGIVTSCCPGSTHCVVTYVTLLG